MISIKIAVVSLTLVHAAFALSDNNQRMDPNKNQWGHPGYHQGSSMQHDSMKMNAQHDSEFGYHDESELHHDDMYHGTPEQDRMHYYSQELKEELPYHDTNMLHPDDFYTTEDSMMPVTNDDSPFEGYPGATLLTDLCVDRYVTCNNQCDFVDCVKCYTVLIGCQFKYILNKPLPSTMDSVTKTSTMGPMEHQPALKDTASATVKQLCMEKYKLCTDSCSYFYCMNCYTVLIGCQLEYAIPYDAPVMHS